MMGFCLSLSLYIYIYDTHPVSILLAKAGMNPSFGTQLFFLLLFLFDSLLGSQHTLGPLKVPGKMTLIITNHRSIF